MFKYSLLSKVCYYVTASVTKAVMLRAEQQTLHTSVLEQKQELSLNADTGSIIANGAIQSCW